MTSVQDGLHELTRVNHGDSCVLGKDDFTAIH
jgi:hypothetical protein